ncbi:MAG: HK97 gp10 family phage protein [Mesorhizobium sp.]|nr:HK97-gp10 family putative phage morphogenesis protein [Mesorhizobium sp.]MCO5163536.1 HK97 gp10 family phage protein [Mesorhizobium sp.]
MAVSKQVARLQARMEAIPQRVREAVAPSLVQSANELAGMMRQLAPDDPATDAPDLKSSIAVTAPDQSTPPYSQPGGSKIAGPLEAVVTVGNDAVRYPHLLEYGTSKMEAQPFFWPSVRLLQKRIKNRTKRAVAKAVRDAWKGGA